MRGLEEEFERLEKRFTKIEEMLDRIERKLDMLINMYITVNTILMALLIIILHNTTNDIT